MLPSLMLYTLSVQMKRCTASSTAVWQTFIKGNHGCYLQVIYISYCFYHSRDVNPFEASKQYSFTIHLASHQLPLAMQLKSKKIGFSGDELCFEASSESSSSKPRISHTYFIYLSAILPYSLACFSNYIVRYYI